MCSPFEPEAGELFNVMLSIRYYGTQRCRDFKSSSFSTTQGVERAIRLLNIEYDLLDMGLPKLKSRNCVFRSSFDYPYTLEILFPDCEAGQPSEMVFHTFYQQFSQNPSVLERMQLQSLWIYFIPRTMTKLDRTCFAPYVLNRPQNGWKFWNPERHPETNTYLQRRNLHLRPRDHRRDWSPASSRSRQTSPHAPSTISDRSSSRPLAPNTNSSGSNRPLKPKTRSPSPAAVLPAKYLPPPATPIALIDPTSISSAIQSLSTLVNSEHTHVEDSTPAQSAQALDAPVKKEPDLDPPDMDTDTLRAQLEQSLTQRDLQRKRIRELQQELSAEREARLQAEARLEEEHNLLEAERRKLEGIQRECSAPFTVPVLLDVFLKVDAMARDI
ncbi:hypothetical protein PENSPDRAFT_739373 [Peniophora sp. CONT]|nr:hypothetical protein PENSPDRAFT_739373 [Peniophora sp. CONT]